MDSLSIVRRFVVVSFVIQVLGGILECRVAVVPSPKGEVCRTPISESLAR